MTIVQQYHTATPDHEIETTDRQVLAVARRLAISLRDFSQERLRRRLDAGRDGRAAIRRLIDRGWIVEVPGNYSLTPSLRMSPLGWHESGGVPLWVV